MASLSPRFRDFDAAELLFSQPSRRPKQRFSRSVSTSAIPRHGKDPVVALNRQQSIVPKSENVDKSAIPRSENVEKSTTPKSENVDKSASLPFSNGGSVAANNGKDVNLIKIKPKIIMADAGYVLEDVPHLSDYTPNLPTYPNPLQDNPAYSVVKQYFVDADDTIAQKVIFQRDSPRGIHFRRAGPREKVYFKPDEVHACIVTCGGLCPGINTVIREIVCGLYHMYGVTRVLGIEGGFRGFYAKNTIPLNPQVVNDIHKKGGTILGTSRGGHDASKIVDSIQERGINQVYIIGGDGTQKGASVIYEEVKRRSLKVSVVGIPKAIDNDIPVIDKSFGFDTAVEEAERAINAAHVEAESVENGIGVVKLMGRYSGFIAMYATLASRDVDCCLIPESPFSLEGHGGIFEFIEKRLKENGHLVIVIAEGAGQELLSESISTTDNQDASGNKLLHDVGLWLSQKIRAHFAKQQKMAINLKYIDPTYMIRAVASNASDNVCCTLLAQSAVHGAMAGYTGFTVGPVNGRHAYIPFYRVTEKQNKVVITDRMWARLLSSTNQPSFLNHTIMTAVKEEEEAEIQSTGKKSYSVRQKRPSNVEGLPVSSILKQFQKFKVEEEPEIQPTNEKRYPAIQAQREKVEDFSVSSILKQFQKFKVEEEPQSQLIYEKSYPAIQAQPEKVEDVSVSSILKQFQKFKWDEEPEIQPTNEKKSYPAIPAQPEKVEDYSVSSILRQFQKFKAEDEPQIQPTSEKNYPNLQVQPSKVEELPVSSILKQFQNFRADEEPGIQPANEKSYPVLQVQQAKDDEDLPVSSILKQFKKF